MQIPDNATMREMVDAFKANKEAQQKLREFNKLNPIKATYLPDGTYHLKDGHHRTFLLDQVGDKTVSAIVSGRPTATQPTPAAPAPTTETAAPAATTEVIADPKEETLKKMNTLADLEVKSDENQNKNKQTRASAKRKMDKMLAEDARLAEVNANFDKAVNDLEKAGKLKVRCP